MLVSLAQYNCYLSPFWPGTVRTNSNTSDSISSIDVCQQRAHIRVVSATAGRAMINFRRFIELWAKFRRDPKGWHDIYSSQGSRERYMSPSGSRAEHLTPRQLVQSEMHALCGLIPRSLVDSSIQKSWKPAGRKAPAAYRLQIDCPCCRLQRMWHVLNTWYSVVVATAWMYRFYSRYASFYIVF